MTAPDSTPARISSWAAIAFRRSASSLSRSRTPAASPASAAACISASLAASTAGAASARARAIAPIAASIAPSAAPARLGAAARAARAAVRTASVACVSSAVMTPRLQCFPGSPPGARGRCCAFPLAAGRLKPMPSLLSVRRQRRALWLAGGLGVRIRAQRRGVQGAVQAAERLAARLGRPLAPGRR